MRTMIRIFTVMCFLAAIIRADDSDNMIFARDDSQPLTNNSPVADENDGSEVLVTRQTDSSEDLSITPDQFIPIVSDNPTTNNSDSESDNKSDSDSSSSSDSESDNNSDSGAND
ncbi:unnamed protein product, partial [Adineta steineri]